MRSARFADAKTILVHDVPMPSLERDEVLVQVKNCGICGSDLHVFHGGLPAPEVCPGHEIAGEVVDAGITHIAPGTRVAIEPLIQCGNCPYCKTGNYQVCPLFCVAGNSVDGGFAEFIKMPAYAVFPLPDTVDDEVGSLAEPLAVSVHALRLAQPVAGDRVAVLGAGTIGLTAVAAARAAGAGEIWVTARYPQQEEVARKLGATHVFRGADADAELAARAGESPVDVVIETVGGHADTVNQSVAVVRPRGSVVVLGVFTGASTLNATLMVMKEVRLTGSMTYGRAGARADFETAIEILARDPERYRSIITDRIALADIQQGFEIASDKKRGTIKVTVTP